MVNLLEALYAVSGVCLAVALYHAWKARRGDPAGAGRHRRRAWRWGAATVAGVLLCAALYWYLGRA